MKFKLVVICLGSLGFLSACSSTRHYADQIPEYQSWHRSSLKLPESQFYRAWHGDEQALKSYFDDAWRQMHASEINVEAGEALSATFVVLVRRLGDEAFSAALSKESAEVRSAVASSTNVASFSRYPRSHRLLVTAPKIDFPLLKLYRDG